jgi:hypothetical protein
MNLKPVSRHQTGGSAPNDLMGNWLGTVGYKLANDGIDTRPIK